MEGIVVKSPASLLSFQLEQWNFGMLGRQRLGNGRLSRRLLGFEARGFVAAIAERLVFRLAAAAEI